MSHQVVNGLTKAMLLKNTLNLARHSIHLPRIPLRRQVSPASAVAAQPAPVASQAGRCRNSLDVGCLLDVSFWHRFLHIYIYIYIYMIYIYIHIYIYIYIYVAGTFWYNATVLLGCSSFPVALLSALPLLRWLRSLSPTFGWSQLLAT